MHNITTYRITVDHKKRRCGIGMNIDFLKQAISCEKQEERRREKMQRKERGRERERRGGGDITESRCADK